MKQPLLEKKWKYAYKFNTYLQNFYDLVENDEDKEDKQDKQDKQDKEESSTNSNTLNNVDII